MISSYHPLVIPFTKDEKAELLGNQNGSSQNPQIPQTSVLEMDGMTNNSFKHAGVLGLGYTLSLGSTAAFNVSVNWQFRGNVYDKPVFFRFGYQF